MGKDSIVARLHREVKRVLTLSDLAEGKRLIVAVSGGPDSLALVFALNGVRADLGLDLHGAHLDHGLRGDASTADAQFVADTFRRLGIGLTTEQADVRSFQRERRLSLEQAAREIRYAFLARVARNLRADAIALGHTSDDQAETVLMHIIRGSGLTGLRGMKTLTTRKLDESDVLLVRPLLGLTRKDTADYCHARDLEPRVDESNLSREHGRNRIRLDILPALEQNNPAIRESLNRLSRSAARDLAYLDRRVDDAWREAVREESSHLSLDKSVFVRLDPAIQAHLLRRAVAAVKGNLDELERDHVESMTSLMDGPAGRSLDLPGGLRFSVWYDQATLASETADLCPLPQLEGEYRLKVPGDTLVCGWRVIATLVDRGPADDLGPSPAEGDRGIRQRARAEHAGGSWRESLDGREVLTARLDRQSLGGKIWVRTRRPGDRFQPLGMSQAKKLQDFMVDSKIPRSWRDRVPLIVSEGGIAWVAGWRVAEWAKATAASRRVLELHLTPRRA